jgi:hypothetical protein
MKILKSIANSPSERGIEILYAKQFFHEHQGKILEVGAVLKHWPDASSRYDSHEIVDKTETGPNVRLGDALDLDFAGKSVLSVSTLEHTGFVDIYGKFEFDNKSRDNPIIILNRIAAQSSDYLITWPVGYCKDLDKYFYENRQRFNYLVYHTPGGGIDRWECCDNLDVIPGMFGSLKYVIGDRYASPNGLVVLLKYLWK